DAGILLDRLAKAAHAIVAGGRALDAFDDHDAPLAAQRLQQVAAGVEAEVVVVGGDIADEFAAAYAIVVIDERYPGGVDLFDRRHHAARVDRHEQDRVRLLDRHVLDLGQLLGEIVGTRGRIVRDGSGAHLLRCGLDTRAHERKVRIDLVLVERGELFAGSERSAGAQQGNGSDGEQRGEWWHRAIHDALLCGFPVAGAAMFASPIVTLGRSLLQRGSNGSLPKPRQIETLSASGRRHFAGWAKRRPAGPAPTMAMRINRSSVIRAPSRSMHRRAPRIPRLRSSRRESRDGTPRGRLQPARPAQDRYPPTRPSRRSASAMRRPSVP